MAKILILNTTRVLFQFMLVFFLIVYIIFFCTEVYRNMKKSVNENWIN